MKEALQRITSIAMALIVLFSTMSFSVDMHYCGEHLVDFSLFENVDTCLMKAEMSKSSSECDVIEMDCCTDVEVVQEGQDDLKISFDKLTFEQQTFVATFFNSYINLYEGPEEKIIPFGGHPPPLLVKDIQVLYETFLI